MAIASPLPPVAPLSARPTLDTGRPYGSPFVPLTTAPAPKDTARIEHAAALTAEAEAWVEHATAAGMDPATALRKALSAVGFSVRHRARALAIPSKLRGVKPHQEAVALLAAYADGHPRGGLGLPLEAEGTDDGHIAVNVRLPDDGTLYRLGFVQTKHVAWFRPLLAAGAAIRLSAVTGRIPGRTMGVNVLFAFVGRAIHARRFMLDGEPSPSADDVLLTRHADGRTEVRFGRGPDATVSVGRYEWGYTGSGPARLALAVLYRFVDSHEAKALALAFKTDVIATVPRAGVTLEAAFVRAWIARHHAHA